MANDFTAARKTLLDALQSHLIGPFAGESEMIPERASDRYHAGLLAPSGTPVSPDEDDIEIGDDDSAEGATGEGVFALANATQQSAVGFTFHVKVGSRVRMDATWGQYEAVKDDRNDAEAGEGQSDLAGDASPVDVVGEPRARQRYVWRRAPFSLAAELIAGSSEEMQILAERDGIRLEVFHQIANDVAVVTVSLVNRRDRPGLPNRKRNEHLSDRNIYQAQLRASTADGGCAFLARQSGQYISDPEFLEHELLYRNVRQFAVGHGCAVDWELEEGRVDHATAVCLEWVPAVEIFKASPNVQELHGRRCLDLEFLGTAQGDTLGTELHVLADAYGEWISKLEAGVAEALSQCSAALVPRLRNVAAENIKKCRDVELRIRGGIELVVSDPKARRAFAFANRAMAQSMRITRKGEPTWRPFQLAFLLLALRSSAYCDDAYRKVLDLIWFPTGGGKTEAYLGLAAFVLFFRRLDRESPDLGGGTAVITRYTLRLLTMQQLERGARTVMACEWIRRQNGELGKEKFSIGLFVGNSATPEKIEEARKIIGGESEGDSALTTLPLSKCPWCGTSLSKKCQAVDATAKRVHTKCPNIDCEFHDDVPVICVDEELYEHPPSVVIGTIDKFAMLAWKPRMATLFGVGTQKSPPSLIIQDELHLISDALGTMAGLYETAIDALCTGPWGQPKIIGSTATIRRAASQVHAVFLRGVCQFPPSGTAYSDSFFYREDRSEPGRLYVGVHAQGRSPKHTLSRLMGILAQGAARIPEAMVRDHYWTLVTYFNSLRELGGAWVLGLDDVPKYLAAIPKPEGERTRSINLITELTSQLPTTEIPRILQNLSRGLGSEDLDHEPVDVLLCTNMISVGVDIDRLGLMIINGQPKTTAEYIQASSRVGRPSGAAGLVATLFNWTRPRDRSHYERFRAYHESFYRNVEATSVTPFSSRARDRALHAIVVALLRSRLPELSAFPARIDEPGLRERRDAVIEEIIVRVHAVTRSDDAVDAVRQEVEEILDLIRAVAKADGGWGPYDNRKSAFMRPPHAACTLGTLETPMSMRDVDAPAQIVLRS